MPYSNVFCLSIRRPYKMTNFPPDPFYPSLPYTYYNGKLIFKVRYLLTSSGWLWVNLVLRFGTNHWVGLWALDLDQAKRFKDISILHTFFWKDLIFHIMIWLLFKIFQNLCLIIKLYGGIKTFWFKILSVLSTHGRQELRPSLLR